MDEFEEINDQLAEQTGATLAMLCMQLFCLLLALLQIAAFPTGLTAITLFLAGQCILGWIVLVYIELLMPRMY